MKLKIIGLGRMGCEIAYTLMLLRSGLELTLEEPLKENKRKAQAEYWDLLPVAKATGNHVCLSYGNVPMDAYILTAGIPRKNPKMPKEYLLKENLRIAEQLTRMIPPEKPLFVVSNPPNEIANELRIRGQNAIPLRACTDAMRGKKVNEFVLTHKGYTAYTPAYACAREIIKHMDGSEDD
jgi:hypothetical protein